MNDVQRAFTIDVAAKMGCSFLQAERAMRTSMGRREIEGAIERRKSLKEAPLPESKAPWE